MRMTGAHRRVPGTETRGVAMAFPGNETHPDCVSATARTIRNVKNIRGLRQIEILVTLTHMWGKFDARKLIKFSSLGIGRDHDMPVRKLDIGPVFIPSQRITEFCLHHLSDLSLI
jgi:hypothetical protein